MSFRNQFSRDAAFRWFCVIVIGFMLRSDHLGITSVIRDLALDGNNYENLRHFFYSTAWRLDKLRHCWYAVVRDSGLIHTVNGRSVLAGDGVKQSKEAKYMPGSGIGGFIKTRIYFWTYVRGNRGSTRKRTTVLPTYVQHPGGVEVCLRMGR